MADSQRGFETVVGDGGITDALEIYTVDKSKTYTVNGEEHTIGGAFQPSVVLDGHGKIHLFFQARLDTSDDNAEKMIAHMVSSDSGATFSEIDFIYAHPLQSYGMSPFLRTSESGGERISLMLCVSMDETLRVHGSAEGVKEKLGFEMSRFKRKAASLLLEFYSDDGGKTWSRKEHHDIMDRVYARNGKEFYLAFMNVLGQVRKIEEDPYAGRLILAGPIRGDYLPCTDYEKFREYNCSSTVLYSDDGGESWTFGGVIADETAFQFNEASAVPVNQGKQLLMVQRVYKDKVPGKMMHYSDDGGVSWGEGVFSTIASTRCLQILETHDDMVLCSTPDHRLRSKGTIYYSRDAGKSWDKKLLEDKLFSYSTVQHLTGDYYMCAWSRGHHGEFGVAAKIFKADWLATE